jgi:hypothetical protein
MRNPTTNSRTRAVIALLLVLSAAASDPAFAHGVRFGIGIGIGVPLFAPAWYYPPPAYYYPAPVVVAQPPVYVERAQAQAAPAPAEQWWYYCPDSKTYYPYVQQCSSQWQRVSPQPPGG